MHAYCNAITKRLDKLADYPINPHIVLLGMCMCAGTDEEARRRAEGDQIILLHKARRNSHAHICERLELFAKEVMPELHADEPAHQAWKAMVMAGEIQLEEIDPAPFRDRFGAQTVPKITVPAGMAQGSSSPARRDLTRKHYQVLAARRSPGVQRRRQVPSGFRRGLMRRQLAVTTPGCTRAVVTFLTRRSQHFVYVNHCLRMQH